MLKTFEKEKFCLYLATLFLSLSFHSSAYAVKSWQDLLKDLGRDGLLSFLESNLEVVNEPDDGGLTIWDIAERDQDLQTMLDGFFVTAEAVDEQQNPSDDMDLEETPSVSKKRKRSRLGISKLFFQFRPSSRATLKSPIFV